MYKLKIFSIGKNKESWLIQALEDYSKRLRPILSIEWIFVKEEIQLLQLLKKESKILALDVHGKMYSSKEFSTWLIKSFEKEGGRLNFVIGGPEGFSNNLRSTIQEFICLSPLTFTHQMARLIFVEQVYRAFEIERGSHYHK